MAGRGVSVRLTVNRLLPACTVDWMGTLPARMGRATEGRHRDLRLLVFHGVNKLLHGFPLSLLLFRPTPPHSRSNS